MSSVALDKFLNDVGLRRPPSASRHSHIPPVGEWTDADKQYWIDLYHDLERSRFKIDFGEVAVYENGARIGEGFEQVLNKAIEYETNDADRSSAGRFSSKLIAFSSFRFSGVSFWIWGFNSPKIHIKIFNRT